MKTPRGQWRREWSVEHDYRSVEVVVGDEDVSAVAAALFGTSHSAPLAADERTAKFAPPSALTLRRTRGAAWVKSPSRRTRKSVFGAGAMAPFRAIQVPLTQAFHCAVPPAPVTAVSRTNPCVIHFVPWLAPFVSERFLKRSSSVGMPDLRWRATRSVTAGSKSRTSSAS